MKIKSIMTFLLTGILACCFVGCSDGKDSSGSDSQSDVTINIDHDKNIYNLKREVKSGVYEGTCKIVKNKYVIAQNKTNYKIVLPVSATSNDMLAASELQELLREATGLLVPIVTDEEISASDKYISLGHTKQFQQTKETITYSEYHRSGYRLFTAKDNIYICGAKESQAYGTLYGVYEYLSQTLNYECYSQNCMVIDKVTALPFYEMDITIIPQNESRALSYMWVNKDPVYQNRMKLVNRYENATDWVLDSHTNLLILPYETYGAAHPDWYMNSQSANKNQLCLTNAEMYDEYVRRVKELIAANPLGVYFMLSNMDNNDYCKCANCTAEIQRCMNVGGYNMAFVNKVADEVGEWLKETYPDREIIFVTYAYLATYAAPVVENADGSYSAYCDDVIPHDNVAVMMAPIHLDYATPITSSNNLTYWKDFEKWNAIVDKLFLYDYGIMYWDGFAFCNDFGSMAENIRYFAEKGCTYYYNNYLSDTASTWYYDLRVYLRSKLTFCPYLEVEELIDDFFAHYFLEAAEPMKQILEELRTWYTYLSEEEDAHPNVSSTYWSTNSKYWPRSMMAEWYDCMDRAYAAVEKYKTEDLTLYNYLYKRIRIIELGLDFHEMKYYSAYYSDQAYADLYDAFVEDLSLCEIRKEKESGSQTFYLTYKR